MTTARRAVTAVALSALGYALAVRPRMLRWGASDEEVRRPYPGADLVQGGRRGATMAITIDAPPSRVWPWLVQMGCDRAGWYPGTASTMGDPECPAHPARVADAVGGRSPRLDPEWPGVVRGCGIGACAFPRLACVTRLARPTFRSGRASPGRLRGCPVGLLAEGVALGAHTSDRQRTLSSRPQFLQTLADVLFWEPAHWVMQTRQLANLKRRAERQSLEGAFETVEGPRVNRGRPA